MISENLGSMGAGFSIKQGVTTKLQFKVQRQEQEIQILKTTKSVINLTKQMFQNLF